jgi:DnaJ-class molecular chaperone
MKITCPDCQGKGGWGHYDDDEFDYFGLATIRARKETFFPCATCHGHGTIEKHTHEEHKIESHAR